MIAMGMRDIDCLQRLSARNNGVRQTVGLFYGEEGITMRPSGLTARRALLRPPPVPESELLSPLDEIIEDDRND
jgi:hypothetical protein